MNRRSTKRHLSDSDCDICKSRKPPVIKRSESWAPDTPSTTKHIGAKQRQSVSTLVTPLLPVPHSRKVPLPVNKKVSFPVIKPKHERLQGDFYRLKHTLSLISSDGFENDVSSKKSHAVKKDSVEHRMSPFDDYLKRLKLKEELPWRNRVDSNKLMDEKPKVSDKRVYFRLD